MDRGKATGTIESTGEPPSKIAWRASKEVTRVSRHQGLHREFDGAIDWYSLLPILRRDVENGGVGGFSDSQC